MSQARALIWVQHLLGIGHLRRAASLARALAERDFDVLLVSGGMPLKGLDLGAAKFEQLPPLRATDASFSTLADAGGEAPDSAFRAMRRDRLLGLYRAHRPEAIITEMYPFGRRKFAAELLPLLEAAHQSRPKPAIFASVRDILTERRDPARNSEMARLALRWYRAVLVHGDPELIPFEGELSGDRADFPSYPLHRLYRRGRPRRGRMAARARLSSRPAAAWSAPISCRRRSKRAN